MRSDDGDENDEPEVQSAQQAYAGMINTGHGGGGTKKFSMIQFEVLFLGDNLAHDD